MANYLTPAQDFISLVELDLFDAIAEFGYLDALEKFGIHPGALSKYILNSPIAFQRYSQARAIYADVLAADVVRIARTELDAQRARNLIDAHKWLASKYKPKEYGERIDVNVTNTVDISGPLNEARARRERLLSSTDCQSVAVNQSPLEIPSVDPFT